MSFGSITIVKTAIKKIKRAKYLSKQWMKTDYAQQHILQILTRKGKWKAEETNGISQKKVSLMGQRPE